MLAGRVMGHVLDIDLHWHIVYSFGACMPGYSICNLVRVVHGLGFEYRCCIYFEWLYICMMIMMIVLM